MRMQFEKSLPEETDLKLVESVQKNTHRYIEIFSQAVDAVMPRETREVTYVYSESSGGVRKLVANIRTVSKMMYLMLSCLSVKGGTRTWPWPWKQTWILQQLLRCSRLS